MCNTCLFSGTRLEAASSTITATVHLNLLYTEHVLGSSLRPGDIVVLDNLASHKDHASLEMIRQAGVEVRFLPPCSPDLNPIEKMWSKIKQILRSVKARTQEVLLAAIAAALEKMPLVGLPRAATVQFKMLENTAQRNRRIEWIVQQQSF